MQKNGERRKLTADFRSDPYLACAGTVEYVGLVSDTVWLRVEHVRRVVSCPRQKAEVSRTKAELLASHVHVRRCPAANRHFMSALASCDAQLCRNVILSYGGGLVQR